MHADADDAVISEDQEQTLAQAQQTLQELTETAISAREERSLLTTEMVAPAIQLAQEVARQLHAYGFANQTFEINAGSNHSYTVREVSWKTGRWPRRLQHRAVVLIVCYRWPPHHWELLWNPCDPNSSYNLAHPPRPRFCKYGRIALANANTLIRWGDDALPLLNKIRETEHKLTANVRKGLAANLAALSSLDL